MKCAQCSLDAIVRVTVEGSLPTVVCETHRAAIVARIAQAAEKLGRGNANLQAVLLKSIESISFEDLPMEELSARPGQVPRRP